MPTVLLLDVSLSMACESQTKPCSQADNPAIPLSVQAYQGNSDVDGDSSITKKALAVHSIYRFLDGLGHQAKLEYVSLVIFSSLWEVAVPFTRDYDAIKSAADNVKLYDKTCLFGAFTAAVEVVINAWGNTTPSKVIIISDGMIDITADVYEKIITLSVPFPCDFHMFCLTATTETCRKDNISKVNRVMEAVGGGMSIPDNTGFQSVNTMVDGYVEKTYRVYSGMLLCGNLSSKVQLYPPPSNAIREDDFTYEELEFPHQISIVGFISQSQIKSPACLSKHLVLPLREVFDVGEKDDGKCTAFTVLLHGALKVESYVAIAKIRDKWYGMLHSWADSRKKSNLVLSVFKPGLYSVPWLGNFQMLNTLPDLHQPLSGATQLTGLPVPVEDKKSYSSSSPSWLRQLTLQSDVQKLVRYGRKLPDKLNVFYKELNRIQKAAISIGFYQLFTRLSQILERECTLLPPTAHPDAAIQLQHAAGLLSKKEVLNINYIIRPHESHFQPSH
ncbi:integrator complex subunit 14-like [Watersipora subatra]|uniref:integrator complex subunit 14-like n=1 Tax=Watersipora subatra TaxID=2589382 RepID=UPI00355C2211